MIFSRKRKHRIGNPDPIAFLERLGRARLGEDYSEADRYRDFRRVFLETSRGRRVLWQIFEMGNLFAPVAVLPSDPHAAYHRDGARNLALNILAILNADPGAIPDSGYGEAPDE
jgi:hypothetical protein